MMELDDLGVVQRSMGPGRDASGGRIDRRSPFVASDSPPKPHGLADRTWLMMASGVNGWSFRCVDHVPSQR
jgi:hypothetical protein